MIRPLTFITQISNKRAAIIGIATVAVYIFTVVLGTIITPGYSNISKDISQLTADGAVARDILNPLFLIYNLLLVWFGLLLFAQSRLKLAKHASILLCGIGLLGALIWFFPIHLRGSDPVPTSTAHMVIVSIISLMTVVATVLFGIAYRKSHEFKAISRVSYAAAILFFVSGPFAAAFVTSPYAGLFERIPIGTLLAWIVVVSILLYQSKHKL